MAKRRSEQQILIIRGLNAGMTRTQMIEKMGCHQPNFSGWETGRTGIGLENYLKLVKIVERAEARARVAG